MKEIIKCSYGVVLTTLMLVVLGVLNTGSAVKAYGTKTYEDFEYNEYDGGVRIEKYKGDKEDVVIPGEIDGKTVKSMGNYAFNDCSIVKSITIPSSLTLIYYDDTDDLFDGCTSLEAIVVEAGNEVFDSRDDCNAIIDTETNELVVGCKKTTIPSSVTSIGRYAFKNCKDLTEIKMPDGIKSIGYGAFWGCSQLASISIPESVTEIERAAFRDCSSLTSVTIPKAVTSIGIGALEGCSSLDSIQVEAGNETYEDGGCNAIIDKKSKALIVGCNKTEIPNYITQIGNSAFKGCVGLESVNIPEDVTSIGYSAFEGCSALTSINIPDGVTVIEPNTFTGCIGLTSITIPENVTSIGRSAFGGCIGLKAITIPKNVTLIGWSYDSGEDPINRSYESIFGNCTGLESIIVEEGNKVYDSRDNCNAVIETSTNTLVAGCKKTTIPSSVTSIGQYAFAGYSALTDITIPGNVSNISRCTFENCSGLKNVTLSEGVTGIGYHSFGWCKSLASVTIPESVTNIDEYAFADGNDSIVFNVIAGSYADTWAKDKGYKVNYINKDTGAGDMDKNNNSDDNKNKDENSNPTPQTPDVPQTPDTPQNSTTETTTGNPAAVGTILTSDGTKGTYKVVSADTTNPTVAFTGVTDKKAASITIPKKITVDNIEYTVTAIADNAFKGNSKIKKVTVSTNITSIGKNAFANCKNLKTITIKSTSLKSVGKNALKGISKKAVIKVPKKKYKAYKKLFAKKTGFKKTMKIKK